MTEIENEEESIQLLGITEAIEALKTGRSPGEDNIPIELINKSGEYYAQTIHHLCNLIWNTRKWPKDWKKSIFIPIPKKRKRQQDNGAP